MSKHLIFRLALAVAAAVFASCAFAAYGFDLFEFFNAPQLLIVIFFISALAGLSVVLTAYFLTVDKSELTEKSILDNSLTGIFIAEAGFGMGSVLYLNPSLAELFGVTAGILMSDEFLPEQFWIRPAERSEFLERLTRDKNVVGAEIEFNTAKGNAWWGRLSARYIDSPKGERVQGTLIDVSEKKKFEKVLTEYKDTLEKEVVLRTRERDETQRVTILGLSKITEYRDPETGDHVLRMAHYSRIMTRAMGRLPAYRDYITEKYVDEIFISAPLHDIGKVGIEDRILKKPGKLTPEEFEIMKYHTIYGGDTLRDVEKQLSFESFLTLGKEIAYNHHQKWDGMGYPNFSPEGKPTLGLPGHQPLAGSKIPLSARIVSLADVYDALTSKRCYKEAMPPDKAKAIIVNERGSHFDPDVVDAFLSCEEEFLQVLRKLGE